MTFELSNVRLHQVGITEASATCGVPQMQAHLYAVRFFSFLVAVLQIAQAARSRADASAESFSTPHSSGSVPFSRSVSLALGDDSAKCCMHHAIACADIRHAYPLPHHEVVTSGPFAIQVSVRGQRHVEGLSRQGEHQAACPAA